MKHLTSFLLLALSVTVLFAQPRTGGGQRPNVTGRLYGKIVDANGKGVEFASVQLLQNRMDTVTKKRSEAVIAGMLTVTNGEFSLENVPAFGPLKLKVSAIGYEEITQDVSFNLNAAGAKPGDMSAMAGALDKDLGNIRIVVSDKILDNVTVTSTKPGLTLGIDRKIFNVDKNITSAGGTAIDIMRNVPSLNVDIDGNVTMRNNSPQVFVDGRPSNLTLEQIPADAVQSVELITNPSAKFDASGGTACILNIVLKKEKKVGYNGSLRANIDSRARVGMGGDINLRQQKVNFFASGMYNQRRSISSGTTERYNFFSTPLEEVYQRDRSRQDGAFGFGRLGMDYFMSNRNTFSISANLARGGFKPNSTSYIDYGYPADPSLNEYQERFSNNKSNFRNLGTTVSFKHLFPKAGQEFTTDVTYNRSRNENTAFIETDYYNSANAGITPDRRFRQQQLVDGGSENTVIQADYANPINEKSKFEVGLRAQLRNNNSSNGFYIDSSNTGKYTIQPSSQMDYKSNDQVYAAYATYSAQHKTFGYQLGLRAESSNYEGELLKTSELFKIDFPLSFFPSIFLSQKLGETQSLQLNYSRRINRPNFWQLTPFTDSSDRLNPSKGNPGLKPEFTNSFELSYEKTFRNKGNFLASVYYKHTTDLITRFQEQGVGSGGEDIVISTYINANNSYVGGIELTSRNNLTKWWEFTPNVNIYQSRVDIAIPGEPEQERLTSYFAKINNTFKLPKNFSLQLSGDYQSKTILPPGGSNSRGGGGFGGGMFGGPASASQGYVRPNYGVDAAVRLEFMKNKTASISLNVNDIFRTRRSDIHSESTLFTQDSYRIRDQRVFRLNFNWRFGKFDPSLFKRKNLKGEREGSNIEMGQ
ncbi:MAG: TonB-dependent receptor [Chitinophagaceae bacterium]|nr:MAG: TonB-dependent receptor [Chitinophagaceae bacterium]